MKHRRDLFTDRQRFIIMLVRVAALLYMIIGAVQLGFGQWPGLVGLGCGGTLFGVAALARRAYQRRNSKALLAAIRAHDDRDPNCRCRFCAEARAEGYGDDVD